LEYVLDYALVILPITAFLDCLNEYLVIKCTIYVVGICNIDILNN